MVFVDTPGIHKPRSTLGTRLNETATDALRDVDVIMAVVDATAAIGPGDRTVLARAVQQVHPVHGEHQQEQARGPRLLIVVNKVDRASPSRLLERLAEAKEALDDARRGLPESSTSRCRRGPARAWAS